MKQQADDGQIHGEIRVTERTGSGRTANVKRNIAYGMMQVIVSILLPFIVRTLLIYRWGAEYLGMNGLFTSILSVLSLMELGFGTAVVYSLYKPAAVNDTDTICAYLGYFRRIYRFVGIAVLAVGLALIPFLGNLVRDPELPGGMSLTLTYLIFLSDSVISYLLYGYMTAIPTAFQRRDVLSRIDMFAAVLKCAVQSMILLSTRNFYFYLISMPVITVFRNLVTARVVTKLYPGITCRGGLDTGQKSELYRKVYGILINKLTNVSRNSIDSLCISAFLGLAVTGMYNNYYFVMTGVVSFSAVICGSMMPSVGNSIALESRSKNYNDMRLFDFIYMAAAGWAVTCMLCLYQPFIAVWAGKSMMLGAPVAIGLCAYFYILKTGDIRWVYHEGAGLWWECRFIMIGEAAANVVLNILFCRIWGVAGIVLATVLSVFVTNCLLCPALLFRLYFRNGRLREYWMDHIYYTLTALLTAACSRFICNMLLPESMAMNSGIVKGIVCLAGRLVICSLIAAALFWAIWHKTERYNRAVKWLLPEKH